MLGDILKKNLYLLSKATTDRYGNTAFWIIIRDIAREEIIEHGRPVDSDAIIPLYYSILSKNLEFIPSYFKKIIPSNGQERFRVIVRNVFTSNAFHSDGLANQKGIHAYKQINASKKGRRIVFEPDKEELL